MRVLSENTYQKTIRKLGELAGSRAGIMPDISPRVVLVRCTSATVVGGSAILDECYPARVITPASDVVCPPGEVYDVLLTLLGDAGESVAPVADGVYLCVLSGKVAADEGTYAARLRAFGVAPADAGGSVSRLFSHSTSVNTSGTGETTLHTQAIASGSTAASDVIRATWFGDSGVFPGTLTLRVKNGVGTFGTITLPTTGGAASYQWRVDAVITILSASTVRYSIFGRRMATGITPEENGIIADTSGINYGVSGAESLILTGQMTAGTATLKHGFGELWGA
jgi:hypothetical protein